MMNSKDDNPDFSEQKKVLIVEDEEKNMYLARFLLEKSGFEVLEARDGEEGVHKAIQEKPDLVLMDMQLPKLDGYQATRRIRNQESEEAEKSRIQDPKSKIQNPMRMVLWMNLLSNNGPRSLPRTSSGCAGNFQIIGKEN